MAKDPIAAGDSSRELRPYSEPPRKRRGRALFRLSLLSLLGLTGTGAFGYLWWTQRAEMDGQGSRLAHSRVAAAQCQGQLSRVQKQHDDLTARVASCETEKKTTEQKQHDVENMMVSMEANLHASKEELESLRAQRAETEKRLTTFRNLTAKFQKMIDSGQIEVKVRNGSMLVALPAAVLFPSGSAELSRPGQLAVLEVGVILKQFPDRRFMVVGHTDNLPIKGSSYKDNWQLSTARALTVAEFLISAGISPKNILAAGHGEFDPVASNRTAAGREKNRRIEIELMPNIDEMPSLPKDFDKAGGDKDKDGGKTKPKGA